MIKSGFDLERGKNDENEHIPIEQLKVITHHELQQFESQTLNTEQELNTDNIEELRKVNDYYLNNDIFDTTLLKSLPNYSSNTEFEK